MSLNMLPDTLRTRAQAVANLEITALSRFAKRWSSSHAAQGVRWLSSGFPRQPAKETEDKKTRDCGFRCLRRRGRCGWFNKQGGTEEAKTLSGEGARAGSAWMALPTARCGDLGSDFVCPVSFPSSVPGHGFLPGLRSLHDSLCERARGTAMGHWGATETLRS